MERKQILGKEEVRRKKRRINRMKDIDYGLLCGILLLLFIGVVMVYSSSSYYALYQNESSEFFIKKELVFTVAGIMAMLFTMSFDYHNYKKLTLHIVLTSILLLVLVLFIGANINGATRWIRLGPLSFQPSELAKYAIVLYLAFAIDNGKDKIKNLKGILGYLIFPVIAIGLILLGKNLSIAVIIALTSGVMIISGGANFKSLLPLILGGLTAIGGLIYFESYRLTRFLTFLNPWAADSNDSYQLIQSFYALGSGGLFGVGLGNSRQKALFMPEPHNDFIFSIIGEELGLIGAAFVIILFIFITIKGVQAAVKARDNYGYLLAIGIISIISIQAVINIAVVTGSMPVTGVPLPLVSYGGTSLVFNLTALGILLNISRQSKNNEK